MDKGCEQKEVTIKTIKSKIKEEEKEDMVR